MPGSVSSSFRCLGLSAMATPQRRDNFTFGPVYRPMGHASLSTGKSMPAQDMRRGFVMKPAYARFPPFMVLRHERRFIARSRIGDPYNDAGAGLYPAGRR